MDKPFFIMMYTQHGNNATPILKPGVEENVAFYKTEEEAREIADKHPFANAFGYEIFEMGTGA